MILPENISCALDMLESAGHEAWVVGGCVRDSLMGRLRSRRRPSRSLRDTA